MAKIGIIGGSGLYQMDGIEIKDELSLMTPLGEPSCNYTVGKLGGVEVVFLPRHGKGHSISPSEINYRANIFGMKKLGVDAIISVSACGSLKEELKPMDFVVPDQFVDRALGTRISTFCRDGMVGHVSMAEPFSPEIRAVLIESAKEAQATVHDGGIYLNMEGPQFSTKAESNLYRSWGMDIIGMTNATEAKLAREAQISYATLAAVTDYDCWHADHDAVTVEMIISNLQKNTETAKKILGIAIPKVNQIQAFSAAGAMDTAIVTTRELIPENKLKEIGIT